MIKQKLQIHDVILQPRKSLLIRVIIPWLSIRGTRGISHLSLMNNILQLILKEVGIILIFIYLSYICHH